MRRIAILAAVLCGCGGSAEPAEEAPPRTPAQVHPPRPKDNRPPPGTLWRDEVRATVDQGLGYFLQRVEVEPVVEAGQFRGFRIVGLSPPEWWQSVDLKPGDVVTAVNGMPIERDDQAFAAFESLKTAKELRVSYRRGGQPRDLVYRIVDR